MAITRSIPIPVDPPYDVWVGPGLIDGCGAYLTKTIGRCRLGVITDSTVAPLYLSRAAKSMVRSGFAVKSYVFPAGEASKTMGQLAGILEFLAEQEMTRSDCVIALGGGVCGDLSGFAAGCYLRGIRFVQMPTTLLAAVDSSVGGKTAVNLSAGKNLAGLIHQPSLVLCDTDCLATLPKEVFSDGLAEAVKTGVLSGEALFDLVSQAKVQADITKIIAQCAAFKGQVVAADEFEQDQRRLLNLGHTAGHAIEICSGFGIAHGQAVAMGLALIARASEKLGWSEPGTAGRITAALQGCGLPVDTAFSAAELARAALSDKKRQGSKITLVIPARIGECRLRQVAVADLEAIFQAGMRG